MIWFGFLAIGLAGAIGGAVNALMAPDGVSLPRFVTAAGVQTWVPGAVGSVVVGAVAAMLSWALYGTAAGQVVIGEASALAKTAVTLAALGGAVLVGYSGGRWMKAESDKALNHANAVLTAERLGGGALRSATATEGADSVAIRQILREKTPWEAFQELSKGP